MQVNIYLSFRGECEEAFRFYERCLSGRLGPIFHYADMPAAEAVPDEWRDKVMHGSVTVGNQTLMGADVTPDRYEDPKGFSLSAHPESVREAERIFTELANGGQIVMPLEKTFWAQRFGVVVDRFGVSWMINCEGADQPS